MKKNKGVRIFVWGVLLSFALFCFASVIKIELDINELKEKKNDLSEEADEYEDKIEKVQNDLNTPFDEEYIIRVAKEKLNLRLPEEIIFYNDLAN